MVTTQLQWLPHLRETRGIGIKSPVGGDICSLTEHPDPLYSAMYLEQALCIKLQQTSIKAPFKGNLSFSLQGNRRLCFKHKSGISVQLDLPLALFEQHANALRRLSISPLEVTAGQEVIYIEPHWLNSQQPLYCTLALLPHPMIKALFCSERRVIAAQNAVMIIQTH
ncbi:PTS glucose transporter subunit IIA [Rheinheimera sp. WS51]|uniref:PTS glucose transporter subunit IIA n=1 Tax=Rheinheimera sp. WS51 TaxID=3425886 RepID=UPI003D8B1E78